MKSRVVAFGLLATLVPVILAGCGLFDWEEREPWRAQVEAACFSRKLVKLSSLIQEIDEINGRGICGLDRPLKVAALADGSVQIGGKAVILSCPMTAALETWVRDSVMPAALERYGVPVVELKTMGTYSCRTRNNVPGARLSEHAFANAIDFSGVVLANGYTVTVKKGWRGSEADRAFLRQIAAGACGPFYTLLGPGSDGVHEDHFHLDLARHNNRATIRYCKPKPEMPGPTQPAFEEIPVASASPDMTAWPRVLPQSIEAADRAAGLPPQAPVAPPPAPMPAPVATDIDRELMQPAQPAGCPPGYICTPDPAAGALPPGWSTGPQPLGFGPGSLAQPGPFGDLLGAGETGGSSELSGPGPYSDF